jgi:hypothetical protein
VQIFFPSKIGGCPAWMVPPEPTGVPGLTEDALVCQHCDHRLSFLLQAYTGGFFDGEDAFHRTIFVFCCASAECSKNNRGSYVALRSQLPRVRVRLLNSNALVCQRRAARFPICISRMAVGGLGRREVEAPKKHSSATFASACRPWLWVGAAGGGSAPKKHSAATSSRFVGFSMLIRVVPRPTRPREPGERALRSRSAG